MPPFRYDDFMGGNRTMKIVATEFELRHNQLRAEVSVDGSKDMWSMRQIILHAANDYARRAGQPQFNPKWRPERD